MFNVSLKSQLRVHCNTQVDKWCWEWNVWPEKVMLEITDVWTWSGVPAKMASAYELFKCRKFWLIHAFTSSRQVVKVEDDRAAEVDELVFR